MNIVKRLIRVFEPSIVISLSNPLVTFNGSVFENGVAQLAQNGTNRILKGAAELYILFGRGIRLAHGEQEWPAIQCANVLFAVRMPLLGDPSKRWILLAGNGRIHALM